jgi:hypothetical protein
MDNRKVRCWRVVTREHLGDPGRMYCGFEPPTIERQPLGVSFLFRGELGLAERSHSEIAVLQVLPSAIQSSDGTMT